MYRYSLIFAVLIFAIFDLIRFLKPTLCILQSKTISTLSCLYFEKYFKTHPFTNSKKPQIIWEVFLHQCMDSPRSRQSFHSCSAVKIISEGAFLHLSFLHFRKNILRYLVCKLKYIPYARHYNPRFVYFLPTF